MDMVPLLVGVTSQLPSTLATVPLFNPSSHASLKSKLDGSGLQIKPGINAHLKWGCFKCSDIMYCIS